MVSPLRLRANRRRVERWSLRAAEIFRTNLPMSLTSIAKALPMLAPTVRTAETAEEIVAGAADVLVVADVDVVAAVDAVAVVDVTAADTAGMVAAGGTKSFRHGSARIFTDQKKRLRLRLRLFLFWRAVGQIWGCLEIGVVQG